MTEAEKADEEAQLLMRAMNISGKKVLEAMEAVVRIDPDVFKYLQSVGLSDGDVEAIVEKTLRGQSVAHEMYAGMLEGLKQGLERLARQDKVAYELITKWAEDPNA